MSVGDTSHAHVTFIIATYKRPDALRCALHALLQQTHDDWTALVIGDHCGADTGEALRAVRDSRIRYYNLPVRFGEQAGPNTAGLSIAPETGFLTFLNQDDLLLADHVPHALDRISCSCADFFIGQAGNATHLETMATGQVRPIFTSVLPRSESLENLVMPDQYLFDPSSFWLIRSSLAKQVGPWHPATTLWRFPLRDWIMRAWRLGARFCFGTKITGLRFMTHNLRGTITYDKQSPDLKYMIDLMAVENPDAIRQLVQQQIADSVAQRAHTVTARSIPKLAERLARLGRPALVQLYLRCGLDGFDLWSWLARRAKARNLNSIVTKRLGFELPRTQSIAEFLADPEAHRIL